MLFNVFFLCGIFRAIVLVTFSNVVHFLFLWLCRGACREYFLVFALIVFMILFCGFFEKFLSIFLSMFITLSLWIFSGAFSVDFLSTCCNLIHCSFSDFFREYFGKVS